MLRFLHCADAHLDTPYTVADLDAADLKRAELRAAFSSMLLYIRQNDIRLVLIAGDLFSHAFIKKETISFLWREMEQTPSCHFVITPGNHDFYTDDCVYAQSSLPSNVHVFTSEKVRSVYFEDIGAEVWGFAHVAPQMPGYRPLAGVRPVEKKPGVFRIFCGHADIRGTSEDTPQITKEQLARFGFDYAALGHIHNTEGVRRVGKTYFGYSGCLIGRDFSETGFKGAICGILRTDENGANNVSVRRLRVARRHYEVLTVDLTALRLAQTLTEADVIAHILRTAEDAHITLDRDTVLSLTLTGEIPADLFFEETQLLASLPDIASLTLIDRTVPWQAEALSEDPTLRGAYYNELRDALFSEDETLRQTAAIALRVGLQELKNR